MPTNDNPPDRQPSPAVAERGRRRDRTGAGVRLDRAAAAAGAEPGRRAEVFALCADPLIGAADPVSRKRNEAETERMVDGWRQAWRRDRLDTWVARSDDPCEDGVLVGIGGCFVRDGVAGNLGFRLVHRCWGRAYAYELSTAAVAPARPELPVAASLVEGNDRVAADDGAVRPAPWLAGSRRRRAGRERRAAGVRRPRPARRRPHRPDEPLTSGLRQGGPARSTANCSRR